MKRRNIKQDDPFDWEISKIELNNSESNKVILTSTTRDVNQRPETATSDVANSGYFSENHDPHHPHHINHNNQLMKNMPKQQHQHHRESYSPDVHAYSNQIQKPKSASGSSSRDRGLSPSSGQHKRTNSNKNRFSRVNNEISVTQFAQMDDISRRHGAVTLASKWADGDSYDEDDDDEDEKDKFEEKENFGNVNDENSVKKVKIPSMKRIVNLKPRSTSWTSPSKQSKMKLSRRWWSLPCINDIVINKLKKCHSLIQFNDRRDLLVKFCSLPALHLELSNDENDHSSNQIYVNVNLRSPSSPPPSDHYNQIRRRQYRRRSPKVLCNNIID